MTIAEIPTQQYVGIPLEPDVEITYGDELLVEGEDFTCSYSNNDRDSGTGLVTIEGIGNFKGNKRLYFSIVPGVWSDSDSDSDVQPVPDDEDSDITKPDDNPGTDDSTDSPSAETPGQQVKRITMHRLYNRWTGEHFYTASSGERDYLVSVGWTSEGTGWVAPESGGPVYRLYNPYVEGGDHHYTMDVNEYERLEELGWKQEGVGWRSGGEVKVYREYNPYATTGTHNYTPSENEHRTLVSLGWKDEGVGWYAVAKE